MYLFLLTIYTAAILTKKSSIRTLLKESLLFVATFSYSPIIILLLFLLYQLMYGVLDIIYRNIVNMS